jgi:hypothetical protein
MSTYFFAIKPADEVIQMAIYTIGMNGSEIFNGWNKVEPKLHMELNSAGYLEFIDPLPNSTSEYAIQTDTYVVYEEGVPIFQGRPAESTRLYNNRVKQYIEGCYAYFNDSVVKPFVYQSSISYDDEGGAELSANDMLAYIISQHNAQVAQNRQIQLGTVTVTGTLYRKFNYEPCLQALSNLRDELGGYMVMSYSNDGYTAYLNWYSTLPNSTGQTVELGKNITDLSEKLAMSGVPTVLIPLGNEIEMIDEETPEQPADDTHILASDTTHLYLVGQRLTLCNRTDVNQGLDYLTNSLTEVLGYQCESKTFDAGSAMELLAMANAYWARKVLQIAFLDVDVADLHYASGYQVANDAIKFATNVSVSANKYVPAISATLPCSVMDIELDNAVKSISLGTLKRDDLSDTIKRDNDDRTATDDNLQEQIDNLDKAIGQGGGGSGGGSNVSYTPAVTSGVELGTLTIDQQPNKIYAPDGGVNCRYVPLVLASLSLDTFTPANMYAQCYINDEWYGSTAVTGIQITGGNIYVPEPSILYSNSVKIYDIVKKCTFSCAGRSFSGFAVFHITIPAHAAAMTSNRINNLTLQMRYLFGTNIANGYKCIAVSSFTPSVTNTNFAVSFNNVIGTTGSNYYTMAPATTEGIGGIMVDGNDASVDAQTGLLNISKESDADVDSAIDDILGA